MHVFVTGASGWIGSAVVPELRRAGHEVTGLARSDAAAARLRDAGVTPVPGDLDDLEAMRRATEDADAVVHLANKHDWSDPAASNRAERAAVETFAAALRGSDRPFLFAAGVAGLGTPMPTEDDPTQSRGPDSPRGGAEAFAMDEVAHGLHSVALRFAPTVHAEGDHGFIPQVVEAARRTGVSGYVGDGEQRWAAVHRADAGALVAAVLGTAPAGTAVHAVAEEGVPTRAIAEAIGRRLDLPVRSVDPADAVDHFGFIGRFWALDMPASNALTRQRFDWTPTHPTLLQDIDAGRYTSA